MDLQAKHAVVLAMGLLSCATPAPPVATVAMEPVGEPPPKVTFVPPEPQEPPRAELQVVEPRDDDRPEPGMSVAVVAPSPDDPMKGAWTLADAVKGLPAGNTLFASIDTSLGTIECKLFDQKAPITVANFVGLARGNRPWKTPQGRWEKRPAYDGTVFHRVIQGFMIQGGDPKKNGTGESGYVFPDEIWPGATHDRAGLLCAANRGPNTNSIQFFITDAAAPHLDKGHTIFGECGPVGLVHKLASVPVGPRDEPATPLAIKRVKISRR